MRPDTEDRPSREQLRKRLSVMKRGVVVIATASFATVAALVAGRTTAHGQGSSPTKATTQQPTRNDDQQQAPSGGFWSTPNDDGTDGSLGSGQSAAPPVAGTHAS
jgi:hypothetical protein